MQLINPNGVAVTPSLRHPVAPSQMRLFARLRWRILRNTVAVLMEQSALRLVSIVLTSVVIWVFVFGVSWSGFHFMAQPPQKVPRLRRHRRRAIRRDVRSTGDDARPLNGADPLQQPVQLRGNSLPAEHAGTRGSGIRAQVPRCPGLQQLGFPAPGHAGPVGLRRRLRGELALLRSFAALHCRLRPGSGLPRGAALPAGH